MLSAFRYHLSVAGFSARLAIQRQLEYPLFLISWLLLIPIQWFSGVWMLKIIVDRFQPLDGWGFPELAFIYGISMFSNALMVIFFIQSWNMDSMVIHGGFDRMLLRPLSVFFQFCIQYINFIGLIDLIPTTVIFLYACHLTHFEWSAVNIGKLILVILGGTLIRSAVYLAQGCVSFWTKKSGSLVWMTATLIDRGTSYPISIYPLWVQFLMTFIIPVGFISFYPSADFLGKADSLIIPAGAAIWTPIVGFALFAAAHAMFRLGLKNYESAGS